MNRDNPCWDCPNSRAGCGNHANCDRYLAYHQKSIELSEERQKRAILNDYTTREVEKSKTGRSAINRYRSKGRR